MDLSGKALKQAAREVVESPSVTVFKTRRCGTEELSLLGSIGGRWTAGLDDLGGLFQL